MPRILLLHASVGSGHKRAAEALARAFRMRQPGQVWVEDTLDHAALLFRQAYTRTYLELSDRAPVLWGYSYYSTDRLESQAFKDLRALIDRIGVTGLGRLVRRRQPEAIICTHFLPVQLLSRTKGAARLPQPLYCVVTDYTAHVFWAYNKVDGYFVATEEVRALLIQRGVPPSIIHVTGIPVDPALMSGKDPAAIRRLRDLGEGPLISFFGGGLDASRVRAAVAHLLELDVSGTLVVVAGRNAELTEALKGLSSSPSLRLIVLGFIDYVDDLVAASDLVITKPGGLIVSEVLARGVPLLLVDPIPGQEDWNADYVTSTGAGAQLRLMAALPSTVARLLGDPERLRDMRGCAGEVGRPSSALDIVDKVLRDLDSGEHGFAIRERPR